MNRFMYRSSNSTILICPPFLFRATNSKPQFGRALSSREANNNSQKISPFIKIVAKQEVVVRIWLMSSSELFHPHHTTPGPNVIKKNSCSAEHEILNAYKYKYIQTFSIFQAQISLECYFSCP